MFRFTIRDVLWLTVVVAMGVCWIVQQNRMQFRAAAAEDTARVAEERLAYLEKVMRADGYTVTWVEGFYRLRMDIDPPLPPVPRPRPARTLAAGPPH